MQHRHPVIEAALVQRGRLVILRLEETVVDCRTQRYACCRNKPAQNPALVGSSGRILGHEYVLSEIGSAHVSTPVTNAHIGSRPMLNNTNTPNPITSYPPS